MALTLTPEERAMASGESGPNLRMQSKLFHFLFSVF